MNFCVCEECKEAIGHMVEWPKAAASHTKEFPDHTRFLEISVPQRLLKKKKRAYEKVRRKHKP